MENKKYVIGADIGGTTVKLGLFEADGNIVNIDSFSRILRSARLRKTQERRRTFRAP